MFLISNGLYLILYRTHVILPNTIRQPVFTITVTAVNNPIKSALETILNGVGKEYDG